MNSTTRAEIIRYKDAFLAVSVESDVYDLASHMRDSDLIELRKAGLVDPFLSLYMSYCSSVINYSIVMDSGRVAAMLGVAPAPNNPAFGIVWLIGSDELPRYRIPFIRHKGRFLAEMLSRFNIIGNFVDEDNSLSLKWLEYMGFKALFNIEGFIYMQLIGGEFI